MVQQRVLLLLLAIILVVPMVAADDQTSILVHTLTDHNVTVNVIDPKNGDALDMLNNNSDANGDSSLVYTSASRRDISLYILVRKEGKIILTKQVDDITTGATVNVEILYPKPAAPKVVNVTNSTSANTTSVNTSVNSTPAHVVNATPVPIIDSSNENTTKITGKASFDLSSFPTYGYYIIAAAIIAGLLFMLNKNGFFSSLSLPSFSQASTKGPLTPPKQTFKDSELAAAERKIKDAASELQRIKEKRMKEIDAQKKFEEAKRALEKARGY